MDLLRIASRVAGHGDELVYLAGNPKAETEEEMAKRIWDAIGGDAQKMKGMHSLLAHATIFPTIHMSESELAADDKAFPGSAEDYNRASRVWRAKNGHGKRTDLFQVSRLLRKLEQGG